MGLALVTLLRGLVRIGPLAQARSRPSRHIPKILSENFESGSVLIALTSECKLRANPHIQTLPQRLFLGLSGPYL